MARVSRFEIAAHILIALSSLAAIAAVFLDLGETVVQWCFLAMLASIGYSVLLILIDGTIGLFQLFGRLVARLRLERESMRVARGEKKPDLHEPQG